MYVGTKYIQSHYSLYDQNHMDANLATFDHWNFESIYTVLYFNGGNDNPPYLFF